MGFAINDIIVVFDCVRENFRSLRVEPLEDGWNRSINQTLSHAVITAVMFFLSARALYPVRRYLDAGPGADAHGRCGDRGGSSIVVAVPMLLRLACLAVIKQDLLPSAGDVEALARRP